MLGGAMTAADVGRLRSMCLAIELRSLTEDRRDAEVSTIPVEIWDSGLSAVAAALRASLGEASGVDLLVAGAPMLSQLALTLRTLPTRRSGFTPSLDRRHLQEMGEIVDAIRTRGWNVWMLESLPHPQNDSADTDWN